MHRVNYYVECSTDSREWQRYFATWEALIKYLYAENQKHKEDISYDFNVYEAHTDSQIYIADYQLERFYIEV